MSVNIGDGDDLETMKRPLELRWKISQLNYGSKLLASQQHLSYSIFNLKALPAGITGRMIHNLSLQGQEHE